jgi:Family of unknown function (DUF6152)
MLRLSLAVAFALVSWVTSPAQAHHSFAAGYDGEKQVTLTGTVAKVEWTNPHFHFSVDVPGEGGAVTQWRFEGYPPNMLVRQGWRRDETMKPGDTVTVFGWAARSEPNLAAARHVTFADGRKLAAGPPAGTGGR